VSITYRLPCACLAFRDPSGETDDWIVEALSARGCKSHDGGARLSADEMAMIRRLDAEWDRAEAEYLEQS